MAPKKFDSRALMELAVQVMNDSLAERRGDGKTSPLVGAVLWKTDGTTGTACRGELRDGDHAQFTLLERKNRSEKLDDAELFGTLEPCAPGARRKPKLSCAERILLARIKEVWVGVEDPDPTVDRKGITACPNPRGRSAKAHKGIGWRNDRPERLRPPPEGRRPRYSFHTWRTSCRSA